MKRKLLAYFVLSTSLALVATAAGASATGDGKFEWTTESADAKKLIHELQSRIENFQFGSDTAELARNLVAADPDFAMGVYYLSAVVPGPESNEALEKAVKLAKRGGRNRQNTKDGGLERKPSLVFAASELESKGRGRFTWR